MVTFRAIEDITMGGKVEIIEEIRKDKFGKVRAAVSNFSIKIKELQTSKS